MSIKSSSPKQRLGCRLSPALVKALRMEAAESGEADTSPVIEAALRKNPKIRKRLRAIEAPAERAAQPAPAH